MRSIKLLTLLLGLALLVSAGRESIADGYSYRELSERESSRSAKGRTGGLSRGSGIDNSARGSRQRRLDGYYNRDAYMATLYYYNEETGTEVKCSDDLWNDYCREKHLEKKKDAENDYSLGYIALGVCILCTMALGIGCFVCGHARANQWRPSDGDVQIAQ